MSRLCGCGCGKEVIGRKDRQFIDRFHYQKWYRRNKHSKTGRKCKCGCGRELKGFSTKWFSGGCRSRFVNARTKKWKEANGAKDKPSVHRPCKEPGRPPHIHDYCHQDRGECQVYAECMGHNHTGKCYIPERYGETTGSNFRSVGKIVWSKYASR